MIDEKLKHRILIGEPLANVLRPANFEEFFGQEEILGQGKILRELIQNDSLHSVIFYGPPGVGKTTLARLIASQTSAEFIAMSAVESGVGELRKIVEKARELKRLGGKTVLFIDEIHRFSKSQQDALLPHTEDGTIVLIGATTENPSFEVISALLSRSQVFVFKALGDDDLDKIIDKALALFDGKSLNKEAREFLIGFANGDGRNLLNNLEIILKLSKNNEITLETVHEILQRKNLRYDKKGEEHYNIISALHKSMRDSDAQGALYWMQRMLEGGEDPLYIARRLIRFASEDIGMADPNALSQAVAALQACHFNGMPECGVNLAQAVVYMSYAPKSNALYGAYQSVQKDISRFGNLDVPIHLKNAPTKLMKKWGYGKDYKYAHSFENAKVDQQHLPDVLKDRVYYEPTDRGIEGRIKERLKKENP